MRRTKNYGRSKKREWQQREAETSEIVDDLAHAATFALMASPSPSAAPVAPTGAPDNDDGEEDDNEIEVMDDDEASSSEEDEDGLGVTGEEEKKSTENESDDDDESDVDLAEAVAKMQEQEDAEDEPATAKISAPKTEHELDAYQTPIQELEKHLQFQLTVEDESGYGAGPPKLRHLDSEHLSLAGRVKHYMATDRTVVVESNPPLNGSANAPLDEGSFLVVRRPAVDEASLGDGTNSNGFIPLGRIFEVFGPVTQPLYTIRLPIPPSSHAKNATKRSQQKLDKNDEVVETTTIALSSIEKNDSGSSSSEEKKLETSKTEENPETGGEACKLATEKADASCESSAFVSLALKEGRSDNNDNFTGDSESMKKIPKESDEQLDGVEHGTSKVTGADQEFKDPWAPGGEFAQLISLKNQNISVYFVKDEAKLIDTGAVMRMSGKGCGKEIKPIVFFLVFYF